MITLTTDFGTTDPFVGIMKGVIATRAPAVSVVDVSHGVPFGNALAGALVLRAAAPFFPERTIHLAVVDPGVGTARRAICIETPTGWFVGPDNGVLTLAAPPSARLRAVEITNPACMLPERSHTFHGRDVFAPAAAALAVGLDTSALGPACADLVQVDLPSPVREGSSIRGEVVYVDGFGNLATNVEAGMLPATVAHVEIGGQRIPGVATAYGAVPTGGLVAVVNSWGVLEIARREGNARATLPADVGTAVTVVAA